MLTYYLSSTRRKNTDQNQKTGLLCNIIIFQNFYKGEGMSPFLHSMFWDSVAILPRNRVFFNEWELSRKFLSGIFDFQFLLQNNNETLSSKLIFILFDNYQI